MYDAHYISTLCSNNNYTHFFSQGPISMRASSIAFTVSSIAAYPGWWKNRISIRKMRNLVHIFFIHMHNLYAFGVVFFPLLATYLSGSVHLDTLRSSNVRIWASIFRNGHSTRNIQILWDFLLTIRICLSDLSNSRYGPYIKSLECTHFRLSFAFGLHFDTQKALLLKRV